MSVQVPSSGGMSEHENTVEPSRSVIETTTGRSSAELEPRRLVKATVLVRDTTLLIELS